MKYLAPYSTPDTAGDPWRDADYSRHTSQADIEFTSDCNLRCVYCPLSSPHYVSGVMPDAYVETLRRELPERGVRHIGINGHGETTIIPGWADLCRPFIEMAEESHIISNFARAFDREELEALARVKLILVSLDTVDPDLLKQIRRKVDLRTIIANIVNVRMTALRLGAPAPVFQVNAGIYDRNVFGLPELARFCAVVGIQRLSFWNLVVHSVFAEDAKCDTVDSLPPHEQARALAAIEETQKILNENGVECLIPGDFIAGFREKARAATPP